MTSLQSLMMEVTPDLLLKAYASGIFPMAESADDPGLFWVEPEERGILPLDGFHVPRRLARTVRQAPYNIRVDTDFDGMVALCAEAAPNRRDTWINQRIRGLYGELHRKGFAHSVEAWDGDRLVGGLYGVSLRGAFFGESMVSRERDASKIALVHLVERLKAGQYSLLDTQFITAHLQQFGAIEVPRMIYRDLLDEALAVEADFFAIDRQAPQSG